MYTYERPIDTDVDMLAFGFMTLYRNGTIIRIDSDISADYIEAKLVSDAQVFAILHNTSLGLQHEYEICFTLTVCFCDVGIRPAEIMTISGKVYVTNHLFSHAFAIVITFTF